MAGGEGRGCFKKGCLGCLGLTLVIGLILVILVFIGFLTGSGEERFESIDRSHAVPAAPPPIAGVVASDVKEPGRIVLDVHRMFLEIKPGPPGTAIRLEGNYNTGTFVLEESYEPYGESGWTYKLGFDQKGFGIRPFIVDDEKENRLTLILPQGTPIVLEGLVGIGQSSMQLGGLWLLDVDLDIGIGEHEIRFDEPLTAPMQRLRLDTSIGVLRVDRLGNASPSDVWIKHSVGQTRVDLEGHWRRDAERIRTTAERLL